MAAVLEAQLTYMVVGVMHLVYDRAARHEQHPLGHGVVEQVEHRSTEDEVPGMVLPDIEEEEGCTQSGEDVG